MDFIFASAIKKSDASRLVVSYDIACQWHKKLPSRLQALPTAFQPSLDTKTVDFVIPKFHIGAHGSSCQSRFSLNFRPHMGRTDGENIERGWAWMNPASLSTREMGPGYRHDTLDDQWSFWNWRIFVKFGARFTCPVLVRHFSLIQLNPRIGLTLGKRMHDALYYSRLQRKSHDDFTASFTSNDVADWKSMVEAWYADPNNSPDPFQEAEGGTRLHFIFVKAKHLAHTQLSLSPRSVANCRRKTNASFQTELLLSMRSPRLNSWSPGWSSRKRSKCIIAYSV